MNSRPLLIVKIALEVRTLLRTLATFAFGMSAAILIETGAEGWDYWICMNVVFVLWMGVLAIIDRVTSWFIWGRGHEA
jgi:hypothetical protein